MEAGSSFGCRSLVRCLLAALAALAGAGQAAAQPAPPAAVEVADYPWDGGDKLLVRFQLSPDDQPGRDVTQQIQYRVLVSQEPDGQFVEAASGVTADERAYRRGWLTVTVSLAREDQGEPHYVRVVAIDAAGNESPAAEAGPAVSRAQWFDGSRLWMLLITIVLCATVVAFIVYARLGGQIRVRKIPGLEAVDEAVGRATEMGRSCLFVPGIQDMNDIQTIAGITILERVAKTAAHYDARVEVPTCRALVMTAARETVQTAFLAAGRPEAYNPDSIYYVTDEQFGYVAYLSGMMVRERPAACFYMGSFFAESLILAETGNAIGAIQVAGTAQPAQLPFFVAACDYTLIGEEFFAASAYLSGNPEQLGSLKGQDLGKLIVGSLIVVGCVIATCAELTGLPLWQDLLAFVRDTMLR